MVEGSYKFCTGCGETIRTPTLQERARAAESRATRAEQERDTISRVMEDTARELGCASDNEAILEAIARLRQQRDEAYERAAGVATVQAKQGATAEQIGSAIRRLAAGTEKEKRE